jgi:hypothetical protein
MKYLKMLGLVAIAAAALMAIAGAGTASATVLCRTTSTPCAAGQKWETNTQVHFTLKPGTTSEWKTTGGSLENTCTEGTIKGSISSAGSETSTVKISVSKSEWTWGGCTQAQNTLAGGELEVHAIAGSDNGEVRATGFNFTTTIAGVSCNYNFPESTKLGTLTSSGSGGATIDINTVLTKSGGGFLCVPSLQWIEQFTQTEPGSGLFVEPS